MPLVQEPQQRKRVRRDTPTTTTKAKPASTTRRFRLPRIGLRTLLIAGTACLLAGGAYGTHWWQQRYHAEKVMSVGVEEVTTAEYPEDPAGRSVRYGRYHGRQLKLVQKDATRFDFIFEPTAPHVARVTFRDVDVSLMTPSEPEWCKQDAGLERIALTDRQWNRQQVSFDVAGPHVEVSGGDGFEKRNLAAAALAKNCLNAGLWEVILSVKEGDGKAMYYQGWFTFPLGHYKRLFEQNTGRSYWDHWYKLEHWSDPAGTVVALDKLRRVERERTVPVRHDPAEPILVHGEQVRKTRTCQATNLVTFGDLIAKRNITFATFLPPGRYYVDEPWSNEYQRLAKFEKAILREVVTPATAKPLHELELVFHDEHGKPNRFFVGGIDLAAIPRLPKEQYPQGLYMPMGIGVPPFYQSYADLQDNPPHQSPYYSVLLDGEDRWIDHHKVAVDGPVMHRDMDDPSRVHLYLLSYERHSLVAHFVIDTNSTDR